MTAADEGHGRDGHSRDALAAGIGAEVREARLARGLSTRELARLIGTSQPFVTNIENGRIFPSLRTLALLADALAVPASRLLPGSERVERVAAATGMRPRRRAEPPARRLTAAPDRELASFRVELRPGESEPRPFAHDGEDYLLVLSGELALLREGEPALRLAAGEGAWDDGRVPHRLAAPEGSAEPGVGLLVVAAPLAADPDGHGA